MLSIRTTSFLAFVLLSVLFFSTFALHENSWWIHALTKCAPIVVLIIESYDNALFKQNTVGLIFSVIGDILLVNQHDNLIPGATAFAIAHVFYLWNIFKRQSNYSNYLVHKPTLVLVVLANLYVTGTIFLQILAKDPLLFVAIFLYGALLSALVLLAVSDAILRTTKDSVWTCLGFVSFFASDLILICAMLQPFLYARHYNMITYYGAQLMILIGACYP